MAKISLDETPVPAAPLTDTAIDLVLDDFSTLDQAVMEIIPPGHFRAIGSITFAGPSHPKALQLDARNHEKRQFEARQLRLNPRWQAPEKVKEQQEEENAKWVVSRMVSWDIKGRGVDQDGNSVVVAVPFTEAAGVKLLLDPGKAWLYLQCLQFIGTVENFMPSSSRN